MFVKVPSADRAAGQFVITLVLFSISLLSPSLYALGNSEQSQYGQYQASRFSGKQSPVLVNWNTAEGRKRLLQATHQNDFFQLAHHYQPQANPLYCGIASSVIVLNALRADSGRIPSQPDVEVKMPQALGGKTSAYPLYTQSGFLNTLTEQVKSRDVIEARPAAGEDASDPASYSPGLLLHELQGILQTYNVDVTLHYADEDEEDGPETFREVLQQVLADEDGYVLINYRSDLIGQLGGGHISPVGAYDKNTDSVLIMDVSGYMNPWVWVPLYDLYMSMHTVDEADFRGYLVIREKQQQDKP